MSDETVAADAAALVAMTIADLTTHLDGVDLPTLQAALAAEQAKGDATRVGAVAALNAAIAGHPETAAADAAAAEAQADAEQPEQAEGAAQAESPEPAPSLDENDARDPGDESHHDADVDVGELRDPEPDPDAISAAPVRPHEGLVAQLDIRWGELKNFVRDLEGEVEGELGELLQFVRDKL